MKKLKVLSMAAVAAGVVLLTSCLGSGNNESSGSLFGIVDASQTTFQKLVYQHGDYPLYFSEIAKDLNISAGNCLLVGYKVNFDSPDNADVAKNGFYVASYAGATVLDEGSTYASLQDTSRTLSKELLLTDVSFLSAVIKSPNYEKVMLATAMENMLTDQKNNYTLSWNMGEPAVVDGNRVYTLYLRCEKRETGKAPTLTPGGDARAFDLRSFMTPARYAEKAAKKETVNLRIAYAKSFNSDSTKIATWGMSKILQMPIPADK